jgi:hypothetical protein
MGGDLGYINELPFVHEETEIGVHLLAFYIHLVGF